MIGRVKIFQLLLLVTFFGGYRSLQNIDGLFNYGPPAETLNRVHPKNQRYDFIVVGSGSAGSVLANRLSENKRWNILLLEAGGTQSFMHQIPILAGYFSLFPQFSWRYKVEPQKNACLSIRNRQCSWPRGKSLGGTSAINYMIHARGVKEDYDIWAALGNEGWSYDEVLHYFKKAERFDDPGITNTTSYHGHKGYLRVEQSPYHSELAKAWLKAGRELGYDVIDYDSDTEIGFSYTRFNMDRGTRCSASRAYLRINRPNLNIVTGARVVRVLIDDDKRAYGVEYVKNEQSNRVFCSKEVILSAGTIDSAKLLMLSGIGPKDHLEELGIKAIQNSKVGYNLYEHIGFMGLTFLINDTVSVLQSKLADYRVQLQFLLERNGIMASPGTEALAFLKTKYATDNRADVELLFICGSVSSDGGIPLKKSLGITDELYDTVFKPIEDVHVWSVWPIVQYPKSVGRLTLKSKDPFDPPRMEPNFYSHPYDVEIVLEGLKYAINISKTESFQKFGSKLYDVKFPGCTTFEFATDDYWRCAIRHLPSILNHEIGTVRMGPETDPDAVVDPRLRVHGIRGLRVADGSIMPTMPRGHTNAGIFMIGEKAADMIKQDWR